MSGAGPVSLRSLRQCSAGAQLVRVEQQRVQVHLDLHQAHVDQALREAVIRRPLSGPSVGVRVREAVQGLGQEAHAAVQAGDVGLDLALGPPDGLPELGLQLGEVLADAVEAPDGRGPDGDAGAGRQLEGRAQP